MRILVAGAGLGGLAVAVGLARGGHRVTVLEADDSPASRPQGYRVHLDARGLEPLRELLPATAYELVQETCGTFREPRRLEVLSGRLRHLKTVATGPARVDGRQVSTAVDRGTLRAILLAAATDAAVEICWSTAVSGYDDAGSDVLVNAGDSTFEADLLVGCDGARSCVAAQRHPQLVVNDSGAGSIVGRSPVVAASPRLLEGLDHGYVVLRGLRTGVGLGLLRFGRRPDVAGAAAGVPLAAVDDYVMWNLGLRTRAGLEGLSPAALQQNAFQRTRGWHPDVRTLVGAGDPTATFLAPVLTAERPAPWSPSRVTTIGDAAHVMPPDRGSGANLALADAARLVAAVRDVDGADQAELVAAIGAAERAMVDEAFSVSEAGPATDRRG